MNTESSIPKNFNTVSVLSELINEEIIENVLRFDTTDEFENYERSEPEKSEKIIKELLKIIKECFETESITPLDNVVEVVNILDVNSEILTATELLNIPRITEVSHAYPNIISYHILTMEIVDYK